MTCRTSSRIAFLALLALTAACAEAPTAAAQGGEFTADITIYNVIASCREVELVAKGRQLSRRRTISYRIA